MSEVGLAGAGGGGGGEELAGVGEERGLDAVEDVALGDDHGAGTDIEGVAAVGVPVVVDGMEEGVADDLWGAARSVVDVIS